MRILPARPIASLLLGGLVALFPLLCHADDVCPAKTTCDGLHNSVIDLRAAITQRYGDHWTSASLPAHVGDEYSRLDTLDRDAAISAREMTEQWDDIAAKLKRLDFDRRDLESKSRQLNMDQGVLDAKVRDLAGRIQNHNDRLRQHELTRPSPENGPAIDAWNAVVADLNRRATALNAEKEDLTQRQQTLQERRAKLIKDDALIIGRSSALMAQRTRLMRSITTFMTMAGGDTARALALKQLIASGMEISTYTGAQNSPSTAEIDREVAESLAKEAVVQIAKRAGLASGWPAAIVAAEEVVYETGNAAVDARTQEVQKNILLIGDYGRLLKRMKQGGTLKADDPAYQAIRAVLKQKQEDMPADGMDVVLEGLKSREALMAAATSCLGKAAGHYVGHKAEHLGGTVTKHLSNLNREVIGKTMVEFFKQSMNGLGEAGASKAAEKTVEGGSEWIKQQLYGEEQPPPQPRQTYIGPATPEAETQP